jgi:two-component SAPR family response regulator
MLKAVIVDDEIPGIEYLDLLLQDIADVEVVGKYSNPKEALYLIPILKPDIVFLDIEMPLMNGITFTTLLNQMNITTQIIFITAHDNYALDAYRVYAFQYLLKPVNPKELLQAILKLERLITPQQLISESDELKNEAAKPFIRCFGNFEILNSNGELIKWSSVKTKELFAFFALHRDQQLDKWTIGEALWPNYSESQLNNNFHTTLFRLRDMFHNEKLSCPIFSGKGKRMGYLFSPDEYDCDLYRFDLLLSRHTVITKENIREYEQMVRLLRGELLDDMDSLWCIPLKEKYRTLMIKILDEVSNFYTSEAEYEKAVQVLNQSLNLDYFREKTHSSLMHLLYYSKDKQALARHYSNLKSAFRKGLDTEPDHTLVEQYRQLYTDL